mmetsp:Transcript_41532/g.72039  ORF Transcript_41532/g.72039 Transcript_41532/m.72039 type:complete len:211 (-) Transcript_41532:2962-3594(-)
MFSIHFYIDFLYSITRIFVLDCFVVSTLRNGWNSVPPIPFPRFSRTQQSKETSLLMRYSVCINRFVRTPVITARPNRLSSPFFNINICQPTSTFLFVTLASFRFFASILFKQASCLNSKAVSCSLFWPLIEVVCRPKMCFLIPSSHLNERCTERVELVCCSMDGFGRLITLVLFKFAALIPALRERGDFSARWGVSNTGVEMRLSSSTDT